MVDQDIGTSQLFMITIFTFSIIMLRVYHSWDILAASSIQLVANPAGAYSSPNGNNGYVGQPIIWNNLLYMQMASVPYANAGNLASIDGSTLPITLLNFTAQKNGSAALLQWETATEVNNKYFEIQRSSDAVKFAALGTVQGHGTTSLQQQYSFTDNNPSKGINYYRLKQVDDDGNYSYSKIASADFENITAAFSVYPNPASGKINVVLPLSVSISVMSIYDMNGKRVMEKQINANTSSEQFDVSNFAAGIYHIDLIQGTKKQSIQLIKK